MTLKTRILSLNFIVAIFAIVLASVLFLSQSKRARELSNFSQVGELLVLLIDTADALSSESEATWQASPTFSGRTEEGVVKFGEAMERTDLLFAQINQIVDAMNLDEFTPRFAKMIRNELDVQEHIATIRDDMLTSRVRTWASVQLYVAEIGKLISIIPRLTRETNDGELVRKMLIAGSLMQMRIRVYCYESLLAYTFKGGENSGFTEGFTADSTTYKDYMNRLILRIIANAEDDTANRFQEFVLDSDWDALTAANEIAIAGGPGKDSGIDGTQYGDDLEKVLSRTLEKITDFKDYVLQDVHSYTEDQIDAAIRSVSEGTKISEEFRSTPEPRPPSFRGK